MPRRGWMPVLVLLALALVGCSLNIGPGVRGSGDVITESREVGGFDEIVIQGSGEVSVEVTGTESLMIEAEDNIMPLLTTDVVGGRLILGSSGSFSTTRGVTYTITAAELNGVTIEGSGDVVATEIDTGVFDVVIEGSGDVRLHGASDDLFIEIDGSGSVDSLDLDAGTATVTINGSGDALVNASDHVDATVNGSGNVTYTGNPTVDETINGSGEVSRR